MKSLFFTMVALVLASGIPVAAAEKEAKNGNTAKVETEFLGQPNLVKAIRNLNQAKTAVQGGKQDAEVVDLLREVEGTLLKAKDKGNHLVDMRRLAAQAIRNIKKGESAKALNDIDNATKAANRQEKLGRSRASRGGMGR